MLKKIWNKLKHVYILKITKLVNQQITLNINFHTLHVMKFVIEIEKF